MSYWVLTMAPLKVIFSLIHCFYDFFNVSFQKFYYDVPRNDFCFTIQFHKPLTWLRLLLKFSDALLSNSVSVPVSLLLRLRLHTFDFSHFHFSQFFYPSASPRGVFSSELPSKFMTSLFQCFYDLLANLFIPVKEFFQFNSSFTVPISLPYFSNLTFVSFYVISMALIKSKSDNSNT